MTDAYCSCRAVSDDFHIREIIAPTPPHTPPLHDKTNTHHCVSDWFYSRQSVQSQTAIKPICGRVFLSSFLILRPIQEGVRAGSSSTAGSRSED